MPIPICFRCHQPVSPKNDAGKLLVLMVLPGRALIVDGQTCHLLPTPEGCLGHPFLVSYLMDPSPIGSIAREAYLNLQNL